METGSAQFSTWENEGFLYTTISQDDSGSNEDSELD
jgi:hypothetical protein